MMASSEVDVVAGLLAIATKDGALNHPALFVVTKWHWLQSIWARLRPLATSAAWANGLVTSGTRAMTNPPRAMIRRAAFILVAAPDQARTPCSMAGLVMFG
jgi:hypothetical protein